MTHATEPLVCSLPTATAAQQALEWADLSRRAIRIEPLGNGAAMTFRVDLAEEVEDLAAREAECCGFLSIMTSRGNGSVRLEITSDHPDAAAVIELLGGTGAP